MTKSENTPLSKNELEIVRLTVEGESQRSIAETSWSLQLVVCRTLQKTPVIEKLSLQRKSFTIPIYQKMMDNYARGQERIGREIDTMELKELNKYLGHTKTLISAMVIETDS